MNLFNQLKTLEDFRRKQGQLHKLPMVLIIVIMSYMSGYFGQRAVGDFIKRNEKDLLKLFNPKNKRLPSYQTVARILKNIDFEKFSKVFYEWSKNYIKIEKEDWISIDGKAIGGTVTNPNSSKQKFINLVSIFNSKTKQIIALGKVNNKNSEISLVQSLIKKLDLENVVFTLDALHCQKKL